MPDTETESLRAEIAQLRAQVEASAVEIATLHKIVAMSDSGLTNVFKQLAEAQKDTYERLKKVELTVFPNLARDLLDAHKIAGAAGEDRNDLDKRQP